MNPIASAVERFGADRARVYPTVVLAVVAVAYAAFLYMGHGLLDPSGRAIGADFAAFYGAGRLVDDGRAAMAYDMDALHASMRDVLGAEVGRLPVHYPPPALLLFGALAAVPYLGSVALWAILSIFSVTLIAENGTPYNAGRRWLWASPAAVLGVLNGQTGAAIGALATTALTRLDLNPRLAGACAGLLVLKPTFAPIVLVTLLARGAWRALGWAIATAVLVCAASVWMFGLGPWWAWLDDVGLARRILLEGGVSWAKMPTVTASLLNMGLSPTVAQAAQALTGLGVVAVVVLRARRSSARAWVASAVLGTLLCTPFAFDYDLAMTLVAVAILAEEALWTGSWTAALAAVSLWLLPGLLQPAASWHIPLGPIVLLGCMAVPISGTDRRHADRDAESAG